MRCTSPVLVLMSGLPGVGKSAIAAELGRVLPAVVLSVDTIEDAVLRAGLTPSFETGVAAYEVGAAVAEVQLALGFHVIADAGNFVEVGRETWRSAARRAGAAVRVVDVHCSDLVEHERRLRDRVRRLTHHPEPTWEDVQRRRAEVEPWPEPVFGIDSCDALERVVARCATWLRQR